MGRQGIVSGIYDGNRTFTGRCDFTQGGSGLGVQVVKDSQIWYVDSGKASPAASGDGLTWDDAFLTIAEALTAAGDNDIIYIAEGDYVIATALAVANEGLTIIGPNTSCNDYKALIYSSAAIDLMTIDANCVTIVGLGFSAVGGAGKGISISATTASYKCHIAHCRFDGWSAGTVGISCDGDAPDLTVEDCYFRSWQTSCINANATRDLYRRNMFYVTTDKIGIQYVPTTGTRPDGRILDNDFVGQANSSTTAIAFTGTPTRGTLMIARNLLAGAWDVTIEAEATDAGVENYEGTTTGGSLIDCNSSA